MTLSFGIIMGYGLPNRAQICQRNRTYTPLDNALSTVRAGLKENHLSIAYNIDKTRLTFGCSETKERAE